VTARPCRRFDIWHKAEERGTLRHDREAEKSLKTYCSIALSLLTGSALGAGAVQALHAEAKPPAYVVSEADVMNVASFNQSYVPSATKALVAAGGTFIARDGKAESLYGVPPKRISIVKFSSLAAAEAALNSPAYKEAKDDGDHAADFRIYAVEGLPPG
jgi:uncharacterized protein (DUF1330 family)